MGSALTAWHLHVISAQRKESQARFNSNHEQAILSQRLSEDPSPSQLAMLHGVTLLVQVDGIEAA